MPYKHIAAHLNKTELACRLHYHQISHGSNRRKRNASCSSVPLDHSPIILEGSVLQTNRLSPVSTTEGSVSRASTPPNRAMRLPSIASTTSSPKLPTILPKPTALNAQNYSPASAGGHHHHHNLFQAANFQERPSQKQLPRLDTSLPPIGSTSTHRPNHVDMDRLYAIYSAHKMSFWGQIAQEYGPATSASTLEQAWRTGMCCSKQGASPMTPTTSPMDSGRAPFSSRGQDKTSISSILGSDAEPRNAWDRDMVRRVEEERR